MFCGNCGKQFADGDRFCRDCGSEKPVCQQQNGVTDQVPALEAVEFGQKKAFPHPYHKLGGWLSFFMIVQLSGLVCLCFVILVAFPSVLFGDFYDWQKQCVAILSICGVFAAVFGYKSLIMIAGRRPRFLRSVFIFALSSMVTVVLAFVLNRNGIGVSYFMVLVCGLVAIIFVIWIIYCCKSVRVRTYFGSDEYLCESIFFKNVKPPVPADTKPYVSETFNSNSQTLCFLSILSSVACIVMLILKWIRIPMVAYFSEDSTFSVFDVFNQIREISRIIGSDANELMIVAGAIIFICVLCIIVYIINIFQLAAKSKSSRTGGLLAMILMVIFFCIMQGLAFYIASETNSHTYGNAVVALTEIAYAAPVIALVNYFAFIRNIFKAR